MAERGLEPSPAAVAALPPEVRAQLAELELELSEGRRAAGRPAGRASGQAGRASGRRPAPHPRSVVALSLLSLGSPRRTWGRVSWRQSCALRLTSCPSVLPFC